MSKFIISTDSCVDRFKSYLEQNSVYYIIMKRICNGRDIEEIYDSFEEYENFYNDLRKGELPTTTQLNPYELIEYFNGILQKEKEGDIIHLPLSSGLSGTFESAQKAAEEINKGLTGRQIYIIDTLSATLGIAMLCDRLIEMRDNGTDTLDAVRQIELIRDNQQVWAFTGNLFHLKRGGRISGFKAVMGTILNYKPVIIINNKGKLVIENKIKGAKKTVEYIISKMYDYGIKAGTDFTKNPVYLFHSSEKECFTLFEEAIYKNFGNVVIKKAMIGPVVGAHVGDGAIALAFEGAKRLEI